MSIKHTLALLAAIVVVQPVFADEEMNSDSKPCGPIIKPCLAAGYSHDGSEGKQFWKDCMKPLVMGKTVTGVAVDSKDIKICRDAKINQLEKELNELRESK